MRINNLSARGEIRGSWLVLLLPSSPLIAILGRQDTSPTANTAVVSVFVVLSGGGKGSAGVPTAATATAQYDLLYKSTS